MPFVSEIDPASQIDCWIFDLDNTLYHPRHCLFDQIDARMGAYISRLEACDLPTARKIQKQYFHQHGTTLAGLMVHHGVEPDHFLDFVHDIDLSVIDTDTALGVALSALPGRRLIFTNADADYAARVLTRLGIGDLFTDIFDIRRAEFIPKPQPAPYAQMCNDHHIDPARAIFFEDMARNLIPAKKMGMRTVWLDNGAESGKRDIDTNMIDHIADDVTTWLNDNVQKAEHL
jgi:putative hydrolase of the HAD superfamily